ncbi:hypothetical protein Mapa_005881 [Marchantia paleacea]|nr:hypothetical protein Mapa_005881 [Marchantia paleacea]
MNFIHISSFPMFPTLNPKVMSYSHNHGKCNPYAISRCTSFRFFMHFAFPIVHSTIIVAFKKNLVGSFSMIKV